MSSKTISLGSVFNEAMGLLVEDLNFLGKVKFMRKSGMTEQDAIQLATYLHCYDVENPPTKIDHLLQSLSADDMALAYGGDPWAWVKYEDVRYTIAVQVTDGAYQGGFWERYSVVQSSEDDEATIVPVLYCHGDEGEVYQVSSPMSHASEELDCAAFGVYVSIMALTWVAEHWMDKNEDMAFHFYQLRDLSIQLMRDGRLYGVTGDSIDKLNRLLD